MSLTIAQITDTHLFRETTAEFRGVNTYQSFIAVVEKLRQISPSPDLLLLTGDLSQDETKESYQILGDHLESLAVPIYSIAGNHDNLQLMEQVLVNQPFSREKYLNLADWQIILLNSAVSGQVAGYLSPETLSYLKTKLSQFNRPTLISLHHHPVEINSEWMDEYKVQNNRKFLEIITGYPQVKIVLFGHIHQEFDSYQNGIRYLGTPSTCIQFQPNNYDLAMDEFKPGFRLLTLLNNGEFDTKVIRV